MQNHRFLAVALVASLITFADFTSSNEEESRVYMSIPMKTDNAKYGPYKELRLILSSNEMSHERYSTMQVKVVRKV